MSERMVLDDVKELADFKEDTIKLGQCTADFINNFFPAYSINNELATDIPQERSLELLNTFTFYKITECTIYDVDDKFVYFAEKMQKLFTTAYAINQSVCYGIVSNEGKTSLLLGVNPASDNNEIKTIIEGLLPGIKIQKYTDRFINSKQITNEEIKDKDRYVGCISGIPALKVNGKYLPKDLSSLIRSLNGQNYTIMVLCKPVSKHKIQEKINQAIQIQDQCFSISKRTISLQNGAAYANTHTDTYNENNSKNITKQNGVNMSGALFMLGTGAVIGSVMPGVGTIIGKIGGGLIGLIVGNQFNFNKSKSKTTGQSISKGYSDAVTETINGNKSISVDIQNGFAIELMKMAEAQIDRFKIGRNIGMWESVVSFSSDSEMTNKIIQGSLYSEIASSIPEVLPPVVFSYKDSLDAKKLPTSKVHTEQLMIPKGFFTDNIESPLCSLVTSEELCGICTIPVDNTVGFEIKEAKNYSLNYVKQNDDRIIGHVCEYDRPLMNVPFGLSEENLNKHTFVCGITGSGKTNTIKKILETTDKPFLVVEPVKKEYRNIKKNVTVYTLGRPEINCLRLNPFYIMPGISPQQHIDFLKDLFSASFAFYGPMPYILEKCLYNIYTKRGWNLTLGFHPCLVNTKNINGFFEETTLKNNYAKDSHKYLFPTMQDLKDEVDYYIENEMTYEGEVKGNIRSAIKARIDSLCVGSKGYMFNTYEMADMDSILNSNSVFELEGLSDDSDKAFAIGLLIIYINEFRQIDREINVVNGLKHLFVIEEAHRLLRNVSIENNEDFGNPKGKAVEHFTNILAEMRSYGQGVIVAEQIPSKLAPEVIKNSSNKIIHRIVAKDDQEVIANTIGVKMEDAIYLGNNKTGYALCHKEGMVEPVVVKIDSVTSQNILDINLYNRDIENKILNINKSIINNQLYEDVMAFSVKTLLSLMYFTNSDMLYKGINMAIDEIFKRLNRKAITLVPGFEKNQCIKEVIFENILSLMTVGIFSKNKLVQDDLKDIIFENIKISDNKKLNKLKRKLEIFYSKKPNKLAVEIVAALLSKEYVEGINLEKAIKDYLLIPNEDFYRETIKFLREVMI